MAQTVEVRQSLQLSNVEIGPDRAASEPPRASHGGVSLRVEDGEMLAVAGAPGFGGTALTRLVAGLAHPQSGRVLVDGVDVTTVEPVRSPVGLVPVDGGLLPQLTLDENMTYGARLAGEANAVVRGRRDRLAERLELVPSLALRPHEVSSGQRIRTALARVAMRRVPPRVLMVDATAGAGRMAGLRPMIDRLWGRSGISVLACTRAPAVVDQADRLVWVESGQVAWTRSLDRVRQRPPQLAVAELALAGPVARLDGVARGGEADCAGLRLPIPPVGPDGRRIIILLTADATELGPLEHGVAAVVAAIDQRDSTAQVLVEPAGRAGERWPARPPGTARLGLRRGDRVGVRVLADRVFVFDGESPGHPLLVPPTWADR
jgi:ABC-type sulfate/molybdate transport systems ATPase subunit